ncbi:MAG: CpXC domain-containing protein [Niabella sp.]
MSKQIELKITCPYCTSQFTGTFYRSIWGEYPENRALVMSDKINVVACPSCKRSIKVPLPLFYTNRAQEFALWWEPNHDPQIDMEAKSYASVLGQNNYLALAPRIKDWAEFKKMILRFEQQRKLQSVTSPSNRQTAFQDKELLQKMEDYLQHIKNQGKKKNSGCAGVLLFFLMAFAGLVYGVCLLTL